MPDKINALKTIPEKREENKKNAVVKIIRKIKP